MQRHAVLARQLLLNHLVVLLLFAFVGSSLVLPLRVLSALFKFVHSQPVLRSLHRKALLGRAIDLFAGRARFHDLPAN